MTLDSPDPFWDRRTRQQSRRRLAAAALAGIIAAMAFLAFAATLGWTA